MHPSSLFHLLNDAHCHSVPSLTVSYLILFKVPVSNTSVVVDLAAPVVMVYKHNFSLPSPCFLPESQFSWFLNKISSLSPSLSYCCSSSSAVWQRNEEDKEILKQVLDILEDRRKVAGVKNKWMNEWMNNIGSCQRREIILHILSLKLKVFRQRPPGILVWFFKSCPSVRSQCSQVCLESLEAEANED